MKQLVRGFTLAEMVIVIVITGIVGAAVAVFMRSPVDAYFDTVRRAEVTDRADNALRRIGRELRHALPNSVRIATDGTGTNTALELLPTRTGGRYRAAVTGTGAGDILDFNNAADSSFDVLGPAVTLAAGDQVVIYNLGIPGADAYAGDTRRAYTGSGGTTNNITFAAVAGTPFPFASPDNRFHVIEGSPVAYNCNTATGRLTRHTGYAITPAQAVPPGGAAVLLAGNVAACAFTYAPLAIAQRMGLVTLALTIASNGESVTLYHTVHVSNVP